MIKNEEEFIELITTNFERIKDIPKNWIGVGDDAAKIFSNDKSLIFCADGVCCLAFLLVLARAMPVDTVFSTRV